MAGKIHLEDMPKLKERATKPLARVNFDLFSSSETSIEGYNHAAIFADCNSGFKWLYVMKTKDELHQVVKTWYSDIADIRQNHILVVVMRDNAGENKSREMIEFFLSKGDQNYFSTAYEPWQDGLAESGIHSTIRLARLATTMSESGLGGRFWFSASTAGMDARNVICKQRFKTTP